MKKIKLLYSKIPSILKNKYTVTLSFFILWIIFIDDYNLIKQYNLQQNVKELKEKKEYYRSQITKDSTALHNLKKNKTEQEKFAREKFLMKKNNEDIFIIRRKEQ